MKCYEKNGLAVYTGDKFIYLATTYLFWKKGASLLEEVYVSSDTPIKKSKKDKIKNKKYTIYRTLELEFAPESYLIKNNYKCYE